MRDGRKGTGAGKGAATGRPRTPAGGGGGGSRLVYSTAPSPAASAAPARGGGRQGAAPPPCRRCGAEPCRCEPWRSLPPAEQEVRVRREKGGRGGKVVTVAGPLVLVRAEAAALVATLKRRYGGGGTLQPATTRGGDAAFDLELQGDHADRLVADLAAAGYRVKRAGG